MHLFCKHSQNCRMQNTTYSSGFNHLNLNLDTLMPYIILALCQLGLHANQCSATAQLLNIIYLIGISFKNNGCILLHFTHTKLEIYLLIKYEIILVYTRFYKYYIKVINFTKYSTIKIFFFFTLPYHNRYNVSSSLTVQGQG